MTPIIQTIELTHTYSAGTPFEHTAIEQVNLSLYAGELVGVIGHTGSGKSTLIQHLNGLLKPSAGTVLFHGEDVWKSKKFTQSIRGKVGLVFQYPEYQLFEETVYLDVAFGPKNLGLSRDEIDARVRRAVRFVGLSEELLEQSPFELSGGQKRRVAIAGVIAMEPEVLILDEPTAGLDAAGRNGILRNIRDYRDTRKAAVLIVSHSMEEVGELCDRLVVLRDGRIAMDGAPGEIFAQAEELQSMGLAVPQVTELFLSLRKQGLPLPENVYTVSRALAALRALRGEAGAC